MSRSADAPAPKLSRIKCRRLSTLDEGPPGAVLLISDTADFGRRYALKDFDREGPADDLPIARAGSVGRRGGGGDAARRAGGGGAGGSGNPPPPPPLPPAAPASLPALVVSSPKSPPQRRPQSLYDIKPSSRKGTGLPSCPAR